MKNQTETPTMVLLATGLALSLSIFAIGASFAAPGHGGPPHGHGPRPTPHAYTAPYARAVTDRDSRADPDARTYRSS